MNHNVRNVQGLHEDAMYLYHNLVVGGDNSADSILYNLNQAIENLKSNWKGKDAGTRIQELISVHNSMVSVRNSLAQLATDSSKVSANYREIQNANGAGLDVLTTVSYEVKTVLPEHVDTADTININPQAEAGKNLIDSANTMLDSFTSEVKTRYNNIMENWTMGSGRDAAQNSFDSFIANVGKYKLTLTDVSTNITKALQNYTF